jgi:hypothetical protein
MLTKERMNVSASLRLRRIKDEKRQRKSASRREVCSVIIPMRSDLSLLVLTLHPSDEVFYVAKIKIASI